MEGPQTYRLFSGSGEVLVRERGARVAALKPRSDLPNALWFGETVQPLSGGDRLWLGPEIDVFYGGDASDRDSWQCPAELDPGTWEAEGGPGRASMVTLRQRALGVDMTRVVTPLSHAPVDCGLPWAGYHVQDAVKTTRGRAGWHVVMIAAPADLYVREASDPVPLYSPAPSPVGGWVTALGKAPEWKLGFPPPSDGRALLAAVGKQDPGPVVVVMTTLDPTGTYVDVPPRGGGPPTATQLYNSPGLGFCELENHFPLESEATESLVFAAWGDRSQRLALVEEVAVATSVDGGAHAA